jgi:alpha-galactosidase
MTTSRHDTTGSATPTTLTWGSDGAQLHFWCGPDGPVTCSVGPEAVAPVDEPGAGTTGAMVEVLLLGEGRAMSSIRTDHTAVGGRMRYVDHRADAAEGTLTIRQRDPQTGLEAVTVFCTLGAQAYRVRTALRNDGADELVLQAASTVALTGLVPMLGDSTGTDLWTARNEWCAEGRWSSQPLSAGPALPEINAPLHQWPSMGCLSRTGHTTWSSGEHLPVAVLENTGSGRALAWEVENNGPWRWELCSQVRHDNLYTLVLLGPTDLHHSWNVTLRPGEAFTTVPASFALSDGGRDGAIGELTQHRRASHVPHTADVSRPLVFNDYMNGLMGDPTTEKLLPLIDAAADAGAQVFCIDAGWYDDGRDWWPSVGAWEPSTTRFAPDGLASVLGRIRERGMQPGLWIEPEVIGVRSPRARELPEDAFLHRQGRRITDHDRHFLDLRSGAARGYLDTVFDRLLGQWGVRYIKWDYNGTPGAGPDRVTAPDAADPERRHELVAPGQGLLEHARAHLDWFERLRARYPEVTFEACSSGGQRTDQAILSHYDLQSTSDQQDFRLSSTIASAAPMAMAPEMAGNWAYPHAGMSLEEVAFTLANGLAGRLYLGGLLHELDAHQRALVQEAVAVYPDVIAHHARALPRWPLGLPAWDAPFHALETHAGNESLLVVWNRAGAEEIVVPLARTAADVLHQDPGRGHISAAADAGSLSDHPEISTVFPTALPTWGVTWDDVEGVLRLDTHGVQNSVRVLRVRW